MGRIYRRQSLGFQVLILAVGGIFSATATAAPASVGLKAESKGKPAVSSVQAIVQSAAKKQDFAPELKQIIKIKPAPVTELVTIFQDGNRAWKERWFAGIALSKFQSKESKEALIKGAKDPLSIIRSASMQSLATYGDDDATNKVLQEGLNDSSLLVRDAAVTSLGKIRDRNAVDQLGKELFNQRNYYRGEPLFAIRENIIQALGDIGSMKGIDPLMKVFEKESNPKLQGLVCTSLEKIVKPEVSKKELNRCPEYWLSWYKDQNTPTAKK